MTEPKRPNILDEVKCGECDKTINGCTCLKRWSPQAKLEECGNYTGEMYQDYRGKYVLYTDFQESERKREAAENMIRELLASAVPHPKEHPTMCAAWKKAVQLLASLKGE